MDLPSVVLALTIYIGKIILLREKSPLTLHQSKCAGLPSGCAELEFLSSSKGGLFPLFLKGSRRTR